MKNLLIKKEEESLFGRFKDFLKSIFGKKQIQNERKDVQELEKSQEVIKSHFEENIKAELLHDFKKEYELDRFIKEIETNPSILEKLSNDRLDKLIAYYEKTIEEKKEKIKKLQANQ